MTDDDEILSEAVRRAVRPLVIATAGFLVVFLVGISVAVGWLYHARADDAARTKVLRINNCRQVNRQFDDYTDGLVRASGGNPNDPALVAKLALITRRDCSPLGVSQYLNNPPADKPCPGDGAGFCVTPTTEAPHG